MNKKITDIKGQTDVSTMKVIEMEKKMNSFGQIID